jgi:hypothetical protein
MPASNTAHSLLAGAVVLITAVLSACSPTASNPATPTISPVVTFANQRTESIFIETIEVPLENCNGSGAVSAQTGRDRSTTVAINLSISGGVEVGISELVSAKLETQLGVENGETTSAQQDITVEVAPGTQVTYTITWYETWQVGDAVVGSVTIPYRVRTGVRGDLGSGTSQQCSGAQSITQPTLPAASATAINLPTLPPPAATTVPPTAQPLIQPTTVPIQADAYPCAAQLIFTTGTQLQVWVSPQRGSPARPPVNQSDVVTIASKRFNDGSQWFEIQYGSNRGWIPSQYVQPSASCPD